MSTLRIRDWRAGVRDVLGPGERAVVWVQGCSLHCRGCMVPETWSPAGGRAVEVAELAREILAVAPLDGVTVSGGEPMEQPGAVAELLAEVRAAGKTVWVYSGYTLEELLARQDAEVDRVLSLADVLVDGRYEQARPEGSGYRGSANQRLVPLTGRALPPPGAPPRVQLTLDHEGRLVVVGVPPPGFLARFRGALEERGVALSADRTWGAATPG
ncbi:MAG TPA: 4Fe-4S single cluster domain-containing protein [Longimicrobium sp.]|nr:4Fe-4S single cluster domain-containing protein [Longimicrobium sp.]